MKKQREKKRGFSIFFHLILDQIIELEQELALFKIPQPEKLDTTLVCSTAPDMVDSSKLPNHVESPKADEEFESKCNKMYLEFGLSICNLGDIVFLSENTALRGSCMVWEINMGVCPRLDFENIMLFNCMGYNFNIYGAFEFLGNSIANL